MTSISSWMLASLDSTTRAMSIWIEEGDVLGERAGKSSASDCWMTGVRRAPLRLRRLTGRAWPMSAFLGNERHIVGIELTPVVRRRQRAREAMAADVEGYELGRATPIIQHRGELLRLVEARDRV